MKEVRKITEVMSKNEMIRDEMSERIIDVAHIIVQNCGVSALTVREILKRLSITNRVFYNRFHNIGEVLAIVYKNTVLKVRKSVSENIDCKTQAEFFEYVNDVMTNVILISYDEKGHFNQYVFDSDSITQSNFEWWTAEIRRLIEYAKERDFIAEVDSDALAYSIWCFCRGYNADAVGRNIPRDVAVKNFRYSFSLLLNGMKK